MQQAFCERLTRMLLYKRQPSGKGKCAQVAYHNDMARPRRKVSSTTVRLEDLLARLLATPLHEQARASSLPVPPPDDTSVAATIRGLQGLLAGSTLPIYESEAAISGGRIEITLGRAPENRIAFPHDTQLNYRHAVLYRAAGQWYCRDLDTRNGTAVGPRPVRGTSQPVPAGAVIEIGAQKFALDYAKPEARTVPTGAPVQTSAPPPPVPPRAASPAAESDLPKLTREPYPPPAPARDFWIDFTSAPLSPDITAAPVVPEAGTWRWIPPGEAVTVREQVIPGGMLYVGKNMKSVRGYTTEPSLINPALKTSIRAAFFSGTQEANPGSLFEMYQASYADATPTARRMYLDWLVGGRQDANLPESLVTLFLYGLERRTIENDGEDLGTDERQQIAAELKRLQKLFPKYSTFQSGTARLLGHFALLDVLEANRSIDAQALLALPRTGYDTPQDLEIALSRIHRDKQTLPALLALAWVWHDPNTPPRTAFLRCPDEMRRLWELRFPQLHPRGLKVTVRNGPLQIFYNPTSHTTFGPVEVTLPKSAGDLRAVSTGTLRKLHAVAETCYADLAAYSRFIGRRPDLAQTPLAVAQLPPELQDNHSAVQALQAHLNDLLPVFDTLPLVQFTGREFIGLLTKTETPSDLGRAESVQSAALLERLGFVVEPDARAGAAPLGLDSTVFIARATPEMAVSTEGGAPPTDNEKAVRGVILLLAAIAETLPAKNRDVEMLAADAAALSAVLPGVSAARCAVLLAFLLSSENALRMPRQAVGATLTETERARVGDLLVEVALRSGSATLDPASLRRLSGAFRALGLDESRLYDRLHHHTTAYRPVVSDDLSTHSIGISSSGSRLTSTDTDALRKRSSKAKPNVLELDAGIIARKIAETEQVSQLLDTIFSDQESPSVIATPTTAVTDKQALFTPTAAIAESGPLDTAHSTLLKNLLAQDEWNSADFTQLARAQSLLPGAAFEVINSVGWETADEAVLEGTDPIWVNKEVAQLLLGEKH